MFGVISLPTPFKVALPNKQLITVSQIGSVHLNEHIILSNVLYIPVFSCNLLSVSKLTQDSQCTVIFYSHNCVFQALTQQKVLATGEHHDGLYYLTQSEVSPSILPSLPSSATVNTASVSTLSASKLWHLRLGHPSNVVLQHIDSLNLSPFDCKSVCPICPMSKQCKQPFPKHSDFHASNVFDLLHMDVWGPYRTSNINGAKYFLTLVDHYTRTTWVFLMSTKQQVFSYFKLFMAYTINQFQKQIKMIRTFYGLYH